MTNMYMYMYSVHVCTAVWHLLGQFFVKVIPYCSAFTST